jgi:hypothetical protein
MGFVLNLVFSTANNPQFTLALILGAPIIPATMLLMCLLVCPESPRYHMRRGPNYNPGKAYAIIKSLRKCEVGHGAINLLTNIALTA